MPTATRLASIIPEEQRGAGDLAAEFYTAATQLASSHAEACPGVPEVVEALTARSIAQAVVSNSLSSFVLECLRAVGVLGFFEGRDCRAPTVAPTALQHSYFAPAALELLVHKVF